jgi:N-acetylglucosamine kinase-like BadF-type ATPase
MSTFLGVDGGGSKTQFVLIDEHGAILATHQEGPAYYLETGMDVLRAMLARGIQATLAAAQVSAAELSYAFLGIPAYGEDSARLAELDAIATPTLEAGRYRCGNDMVCGWAGALVAGEGINIVCGTGSIAYGEYAGRSARAGGWGELFSDEGSAYWVSCRALNLFARMSDGRLARGPLYEALRTHYALAADLELCARVYQHGQDGRSAIARLSPIVASVALAGDPVARGIFLDGARELAAIVDATRARLAVPDGFRIAVSHSGGMFQQPQLLLEPMRRHLEQGGKYELVEPRLPPGAGAALHAARCLGKPLSAAAIERLQDQHRQALAHRASGS